MSIKDQFTQFIHYLQDEICDTLETIDGKAKFKEDAWQREGGGGGKTRILTEGGVFEKGGVNTSIVHGHLPEAMQQQLNVQHSRFFACGISLVLHPFSPMIPTVHANFRYFELYNTEGVIMDSWFGGGTDLTPSYAFEEDFIHFHTTLKNTCDPFGENLYPQYKKQCDEYFINKHRNNEARGVGGIFYDYLRPQNETHAQELLAFSKANGKTFLKAYLPIVEKRRNLPFGEREKTWQAIRRGRYVEFNLIHDKGTLFGLRTNGRIESILMSLPPVAHWAYDYQPEPNTPEAGLLDCLKPRDWVNFKQAVS